MRTSGWSLLLLLLLSLSVLVAVGAACASSPGEDDYVDALMDEVALTGAFGTAADDRCVAEAFVEATGVENLQDADVSPERFAKAENLEELDFWVDSDSAWAAANECTDLGLAIMTHIAGGDPAVAQCLMDTTTDDDRKTHVIASYETHGAGDQEVLGNFDVALSNCTPPD